MKEEKKVFDKAEIEVIKFEKYDVIATSQTGPTGSFDGVWTEEEVDL